jgi:hypothetical protein
MTYASSQLAQKMAIALLDFAIVRTTEKNEGQSKSGRQKHL